MIKYRFYNETLLQTLDNLSTITNRCNCSFSDISRGLDYLDCTIKGYVWDQETCTSSESPELVYDVFLEMIKDYKNPVQVDKDFKDYLETKIDRVSEEVEFYDMCTLNCFDPEEQEKLNLKYIESKQIQDGIYKALKLA